MQILAVELTALVFFVLVIWLVEPIWVLSVLSGGMVHVIPSAYFTLATLSTVGSREPYRFLSAFMRGHTGKMILAAAGFAVAFRMLEALHTPSFFITYCVLMLIHAIAAAKLCRSSVEAEQKSTP